VGNDLVKNLESFGGKKYGVNPTAHPQPLPCKEGSNSYLTMVQKISALPEVPDMAIIVIPAKFVLQSLEEL